MSHWKYNADLRFVIQCRFVHHVEDQCAFVKFHCGDDEEAGLFSYLSFYYCSLPHVKPIAFTIISLWLATLFTTIGIAASEFFCINLSTISNILGLSESMAGVTFLAFGNGSPDVFSTFAAIKSGSGSLAVGELIGAAGFITAVVAGSMALIKDFAVPKKSFLRDVGFFIVAIAFSMSFLANGKLDIWECVVMVAFYVFYVITVIAWHWRLGHKRRRREQEALARGHYVNTEEQELDFEGEFHDDDQTEPTRGPLLRHISDQDFNDLERAGVESLSPFPDLEDEQQRGRFMGELSSNMRVRKPLQGERTSVYNPIRPSLVGALEFQAAMSSMRKAQQVDAAPIHLRRYSDDPLFIRNEPPKRATTFSNSSTTANQEAHADNPNGLLRPRLGDNLDGASRARAASANAADLLKISQKDDKGTQVDSKNTDVEIREDPSQTTNLNESHRTSRGSNPLLSVSPPPEQASRDPSPPRTRSGDSAQGYLAPPGAGQLHPASPDTSQDANSREGRPRLKVTPPPSGWLSPFQHGTGGLTQSPSGSPAPPSLRLPPPSTPGYFNVPEDLQQQSGERPHRLWPYKLLPPPEIVFQTFFPSLCDWRHKGFWERLLCVALIPSFFLLTFTLPVVEPERSDESDPPRPQGGASISSSRPRSVSGVAAGALSPNISGRRDATATVAIDTERRHSQSFPLSENSPLLLPQSVQAQERPHVAVPADRSWNRWLVLIHTVTSPYFIMITVWANFDERNDPRTLLWPSAYSLSASALALALILATTTAARPPRWHFLLCFLGFSVSIAWISSIANEVVGVLKALGVIFNMSDAILGLTIFAVGNSLGDLVADVQVARLGFPYMAFSACFGGPMLNILLGIGLSGIYITLRRADERHHKHPDRDVRIKPYHVEVSITLLISAVALLTTLVGLLVAIPMNGWRMDRRIGTGLMVLWCLATAANVAVELTGAGSSVE